MHYLGACFPSKETHTESEALDADGRRERGREGGKEGEKGRSRRAQGAVATAARAGLGEKSHSPAAHTMKVRARETEPEVLVGSVLGSEVCRPHSRCCGR